MPSGDLRAPLRAGAREGPRRSLERDGDRLALSPVRRETSMPQILLPIQRAWEKV